MQASRQRRRTTIRVRSSSKVFINDTPTDRIGTFALLADQKLAATRGELAELGVNAPGTGAAEDAIVIDAASGIEYRYD